MKIIHILRKPTIEPSIAQNVLKHGCGGLNIDATRILVGEQPQETKAPGWDAYNKANAIQGYRPRDYQQGDATYTPSSNGRWPANLILQHKENCIQTGVLKTKPLNGSGAVRHVPENRKNRIFGKGVGGHGARNGFGDTEGMEGIEEWKCIESCPAKKLQGHIGLGRGATGFSVGTKQALYGPAKRYSGAEYNYDHGGDATRYFKQVK